MLEVCCWLLSDIPTLSELRLLYPRKRTLLTPATPSAHWGMTDPPMVGSSHLNPAFWFWRGSNRFAGEIRT